MVFSTISMALALAAAPADTPVTLQGIGPLRVGMGVAELRRRFGARNEFEPDPESDCSYWRTARYPGVAIMVSGGRIVRIDVDDPRYRTRSGARVGMSERQVRALYGRQMVVEEHPYTHPQGKYLVYRARSEPYSMIFETDNGRAISFRVGLADHVSLIEGCS